MAWHQELLIGFDLETTGTEPREGAALAGQLTASVPQFVQRFTWRFIQ
ncbi:hypothetical protein AB0I50_28270 [Streptomyces prunicolor]